MSLSREVVVKSWQATWCVALCVMMTLGVLGCKTGASEKENDVSKESANTREFTDEELADFLTRNRFDLFGGDVSAQYVDLDGKAPRELLVHLSCEGKACHGDHYEINGSVFFMYDQSTSLQNPSLWTNKPISMGPEAYVQLTDVNADGLDDLVISGLGKSGERWLKVYSVLGKLLSTRFDGALPTHTLSERIIDLDGDGVSEVVTLQRQLLVNETQPYNHYGYYDASLFLGTFDQLKVQSWSLGRNGLQLKSLESYEGFESKYKQLLAEQPRDLNALAQVIVMGKMYQVNIDVPADLQAQLMEEYDRRIRDGEEFRITATPPVDAYGYPQYDQYGNPIKAEDNTTSGQLLMLLAALNTQQGSEIQSWAKKHVDQASSFEALSVFLDLYLASIPEDNKAQSMTSMLETALKVLLEQGPNSQCFYNLAYLPPGTSSIDEAQKQFLIASYLIGEDVKFDGKSKILHAFLDQGTRDNLPALQGLLPQQPLSAAMTPTIIDAGLERLSPELSVLFMTQMLPNYVSVKQSHGGLSKEEKQELVDALLKVVEVHPDRQSDTFQFVSNYLPDPAFGPLIKPELVRLKAVFESGRATQQDRNYMYNAATMLPMALDSLSKRDREWWVNYVYRQGMGYSLDNKMAEGCYNLAAQSEEKINWILTGMETLPKESTLVPVCLPYMLGVYTDGVSPLNEEQFKRIKPIVRNRLKILEDEYQVQQFLMAMAEYKELDSFSDELWGLVKKKRKKTDTGRFQALVLLTRLGDTKAQDMLHKDAIAIFTDSKLRKKVTYFNAYSYVDMLVRYNSEALADIALDVASQKKISKQECKMFKDYMVSYGLTSRFDTEQTKQYSKLCAD